MSQQLYKFQVAFKAETLKFQLARHPSEGDEYFIARVLAYVLHHKEGINAFGQVCQGGERPALTVFSPGMDILEWIEIGAPSESKLKTALRQSEKVFIYLYKRQHQQLAKVLAKLPRKKPLVCQLFEPGFLRALHAEMDEKERNNWDVVLDDTTLTVNGLEGKIEKVF